MNYIAPSSSNIRVIQSSNSVNLYRESRAKSIYLV
nr:MAG TPA: hypothetical protein [Caudoviricetes sp.]